MPTLLWGVGGGVAASRVVMEPWTCDDWEILESNAEHLEGELLNQVSVVYPGQIIPIWVHRSSLISLKVTTTFAPGFGAGPGASPLCVRLTANTEVSVSPKPRQRGSGRRDGGQRHVFASSGPLRVCPPPTATVRSAAEAF
ncbi:unnamed protein product, partial [Discosporangium mesarthrocarpum]